MSRHRMTTRRLREFRKGNNGLRRTVITGVVSGVVRFVLEAVTSRLL
ncbi:hypothetical protein [Streptomyces sp. NPDC091416]